MLITKDFVYLELHKTGSTHVRRILSNMYPKGHLIIGKHNSLDSIPTRYSDDVKDKLIVGNIRNPWDWYVSLWAYGCQKKGGLFERLTRKLRPLSYEYIKNSIKLIINSEFLIRDANFWNKLYSDVYDVDNFNIWLETILTDRKLYLGEDYRKSKLSEFCGLLTFRYLKLYTDQGNLEELNSYEELVEHDDDNNVLDYIIYNESMERDLAKLSKYFTHNEVQLKDVLRRFEKRTNSSKRNRDYRTYYSNNSIDIVREYDWHIIKKFNYTF